MARACTITPPSLRSRAGRPWPLPRFSRESREALGSDGDESNGINTSGLAAGFPERFAGLANGSGIFTQAFAPPGFSAAFGSDSRGAKFFR